MELTPDQAANATERHDCPKCGAPVGSPCRTRGGKTAFKYHTACFTLVAALREDLDVAVPDDRGPGKAWMIRPAADDAPIRVEGAVPIRIGVRQVFDRDPGACQPTGGAEGRAL